MKRVFASEWKRAMNPGIIAAVIGIAFCICFDSWNDLINAVQNRNPAFCVYYFMTNSAFGGMCRLYILPVFTTFPFAASFCEERNSRAVTYIVSREGVKSYSTVKYVVNAVVGGLTAASATALLLLLLLTRMPMTLDSTSAAGAGELFHTWTAIHHPFWYGVTETALGFMRGMIWASTAMTVSLFVTDKFVITMFPFLGSYVITKVAQILSIQNEIRLDLLLIGRIVIKNSGVTVVIAAVASCILVAVMGKFFTTEIARGHKDGTLY